jgi:hypothetical protein
MVITKTLPSEAAAVLEKGVRKMTPRIMTWGQYGEAALNYLQQVCWLVCVGWCWGGWAFAGGPSIMCGARADQHLGMCAFACRALPW